MKVLLLLLLPLFSLSVKTRSIGQGCGKNKKNKNVVCEEGTSCQQWRNEKGEAGDWFCLQKDCEGKGQHVEAGGFKWAACCSELKMKDGQCYKDSTPAEFSNENFCAISKDHTMCKYPGIGSTCPAGRRESGFTDAGKKLIVDKHNELRSRVAKGEEAGQPKASNMWALKWSEELAVVAQRWADQCTWSDITDAQYSDGWMDQEREKLDGTYVGQNTYTSSAIVKQTKDEAMATMDTVVQSWYEEVTKAPFSSSNIEPFQYSKKTGHYSQVVWADTMEIGCGWSYYRDKKDREYKSMVQCNYAIGGNKANAVMYEVGEPCSSCPNQCNSDKLCQVPAE